MFQYFSDIAQNPESNKRQESGGVAGPGKPPWPASVCSLTILARADRMATSVASLAVPWH